MSFVKRSRIISVRVTQDEYEILDQVSRRHGANSVSEFLRQLIMNSEPFALTVKTGVREVAEELDALRRKVDQLSQIVKERGTKPSNEDAAANEKSAALWHEAVADV